MSSIDFKSICMYIIGISISIGILKSLLLHILFSILYSNQIFILVLAQKTHSLHAWCPSKAFSSLKHNSGSLQRKKQLDGLYNPLKLAFS